LRFRGSDDARQHAIDAKASREENQGMKTQSPALAIASWPYGVTVELSSSGVLLKPKPKPRQSWAKAFRSAAVGDETVELREVKNKFDAEEWKW
jgi:hypothetical protein